MNTLTDKRKTGIGGSDVAAIIGEHPYKTAADVYARIVADVEPMKDNTRMALGRAMEGHIIDEYAKRAGVDPSSFERLVELRDAKHPHRRGELDALDRGRALALDAKLVISPRQFARWGEVGSDSVPFEYLCQAHWYSMLARVDTFVIVALIEGDLREFNVPRDAEMQGLLAEAVDKFWRDHVEKKAPPPLTGCAPETLRALFPRNAAPLREATPEEAVIFQNYGAARASAEAWERVTDNLKAELQAIIGDAEGIQCPHGRITWKNNKDGKATDWQAVALALGAQPDLINKHTVTKPGARVFRFSPAKEK